MHCLLLFCSIKGGIINYHSATYKRRYDCPGFFRGRIHLVATLLLDLKVMGPYPSRQKAAECASALPVSAWATNVVF